MLKHPRSASTSSIPHKRPRTTFSPNKVATAEAAAAVDNDPLLPKLLKAVEDSETRPVQGESIIYWMRMSDLRGVPAPFRSDHPTHIPSSFRQQGPFIGIQPSQASGYTTRCYLHLESSRLHGARPVCA